MKAFTAEGMAISNVVNVNTDPRKGFMPVMNMWCPHTMNDKKAIAIMEPIMAR